MTATRNLAILDGLVLSSAPARDEVMHDGWLIRTTANDVKRARSVTALEPPTGALEAQIEWCEQLYEEKGLTPLFRLSPASQPTGLDEALASRGYVLTEPTLVQAVDLVSDALVASTDRPVEAVAAH